MCYKHVRISNKADLIWRRLIKTFDPPVSLLEHFASMKLISYELLIDRKDERFEGLLPLALILGSSDLNPSEERTTENEAMLKYWGNAQVHSPTNHY